MSIFYYQVPSKVLHAVYERMLKETNEQIDIRIEEGKAYEKELKEKGIPALQAKYKELVADWEALPNSDRYATRKPKIVLDQGDGHIIIYEKQTFSSWLENLISWKRDNEDRWYEKNWIYTKDVYNFKYPPVWGIRIELLSRRNFLLQKIREYKEDFLDELPESQVLSLGLKPSDYQKIRRND